MTSTGVILFARLDSRRLPGKALRAVAGRELLGRVLDRTRRAAACADGARIVIATSDRTVDDPIAEFAAAEGAACFRGDCDDVSGRALACLDAFGFERFARICGDSPFIDPELIDRLLALQAESGADLATNILVRSFPPGASVEIVTRDALARLVAATDDPEDREHLTRYFYRRPEAFRIEEVRAPAGGSDGIRLTVDTAEELARAEAVFRRLGEAPERASLAEVVEAMRAVTTRAEGAAVG